MDDKQDTSLYGPFEEVEEFRVVDEAEFRVIEETRHDDAEAMEESQPPERENEEVEGDNVLKDDDQACRNDEQGLHNGNEKMESEELRLPGGFQRSQDDQQPKNEYQQLGDDDRQLRDEDELLLRDDQQSLEENMIARDAEELKDENQKLTDDQQSRDKESANDQRLKDEDQKSKDDDQSFDSEEEEMLVWVERIEKNRRSRSSDEKKSSGRSSSERSVKKAKKEIDRKETNRKVDPEFDFDEADMFVDEKSALLGYLNKIEESLIGMEQIIDDQTHDNLKCILCRIILKDRHAITAHLKDVQHQGLYIKKFHPLVYNCLVSRRESAAVFSEHIKRYAVELVNEHGRKRCRTYLRGKGQQAGTSKSSASTSKESSTAAVKSSDASSDSSFRRRGSYNFESRYRSYYRHYWSTDESTGRKSPHAHKEKSPVDADEDLYGELPADLEISSVLLSSKLEEFGKDEKAFVQDHIERLTRSVVGLGFIAEYADPRGAYQPGYLCAICEGRYSPGQIRVHVTTEKHRLKYMERRYKTYYATVTMRTLPEDTRKDLISRYAREIEKKEGRGSITRKIVIKESERFIFRHHRPIPSTGHSSRKRIASEDPSVDGISSSDIVSRDSLPPPPKLGPAYNRLTIPQRPDFVYSEKKENELRMKELEKLLPPFVERNLEAGWYSIRQYSLDYYQRLVPPLTPYFSLRCPRAVPDIYGSWSPYVMRRIQDQFNFSIEHLSWLQKLLLDWRLPLSKPLEEYELRPLAEDVEEAVLKSLIGSVLQASNLMDKVHQRPVFQYDDRPAENTVSKPAVQTFEYKLDDGASSSGKPEVPEKFVRDRSPSVSSTGNQAPPLQYQSVMFTPTPTPSEDDQKSTVSSKRVVKPNEKAAAERAMLQLIDQVLLVAKESASSNPILNLLLKLENARSVLFVLATGQPAVLQQLVVVMKNPNLVIPPETLAQLEKKLIDVSKEASLSQV